MMTRFKTKVRHVSMINCNDPTEEEDTFYRNMELLARTIKTGHCPSDG